MSKQHSESSGVNPKSPRPTSKHSLGSASSQEEGDVVDYDLFVGDKTNSHHLLPLRKTEYYYQEYPYVKPTQSDFERKELKENKLFGHKEDPAIQDADIERETSILVTGFGMRNVDSFQRLLKMSQEERRKWELRKLWRDSFGKSEAEEGVGETSSHTERTDWTTMTLESKSSDLVTQTDASFKTDAGGDQLKRLDYLMGLEVAVEEFEEVMEIDVEQKSVDDFKYSQCKPVREAQRYLRAHHIFECFQFIVSHMLSAKAENPVEFILSLTNRCLLYRSGLGEPPLLYEKVHINKLFDLMDRFQTGYVELQQYNMAMETLGICTYNKDPDVNNDGMVSRNTFVEEIYDAELAIFDDMIKKRQEKCKVMQKRTPPDFDNISIPSINPPNFIPSDLFKFSQHSLGAGGGTVTDGSTGG